MSDSALILRRASISRISGSWSETDYDVFDGDQDVGRIYCADSRVGRESWFWGVSFMLTGKKSYGNADSLDDAKAAFKAEYERWLQEGSSVISLGQIGRRDRNK
jgi:hypothetical protein